MKTVHCLNCKTKAPAQMKGSGWISFLMLATFSWALLFIPNVVYSVWRRSGNGKCQVCSSTAVVPLGVGVSA